MSAAGGIPSFDRLNLVESISVAEGTSHRGDFAPDDARDQRQEPNFT